MRKNARKSKKCIICQKEFLIMRKEQKYCSIECSYEGQKRKVKTNCSHCKKTIEVIPSKLQLSENIFCNINCKSKWQKENLIGKENPNFRGGLKNLKCPICGKIKEFKICEANNDQIRYCSNECKNKGHSLNISGKNAPNWKGGQLDTICNNCGKNIKRAKWQVLKTQHSFCSKECKNNFHSLFIKGENNPAWIDGNHLKQYPREFLQIKKFIRERDSFLCQLCGIRQEDNNVKLSVHHINYQKKDCKENNLISLCSINGCHQKTNQNRKYWEQYFQNLMIEKYKYQY